MTEETIFAAALEQGSPAERVAFLDQTCAGNDGLRQRVEALLQSHEEAGSFMGKPVPECLADPMGTSETQGEPAAGNPDKNDLAFLTPSDKPGVLGRLGHYEILSVIGRGGMGIVLRAFDEQLHRVVAIKVMATLLASNPVARKRFTREARAAAAVRNEHVTGIYAVEEAGPVPYLVMEYIDGVSLQQRLDRDGPLEVKEILRIGFQAACGLAAAHQQGLVHRDIKPANILLENHVERVKITDFGLARAKDDGSLTQEGLVAGTPQYMSPEQAGGERLDRCSDLFSLGSVLYAMCTGRAPFRGSGTIAILKRVCEETPSSIRESNPDIPDWLASVIGKLHAKDPANRYQSAAEVAELLGRYLAHLQHPSAASLPAGVAGVESAQPRQGVQAGGLKSRSRRRWAVAALGVLCLVAILAVTEATGVTGLRAIVIRNFTPENLQGPLAGAGTSGSELKVGLVRKHRWLGRCAYFTTFSPDSRYYAATGAVESNTAIYTLRVWEVATGKLVMEVVGNESAVFMPDSKQLLAPGPDRKIHLWELATGKEIRQFGQHPDWVRTLDLTPAGNQVLSGCNDGILRLWDVASGQEIAKFEGHGQPCDGCISPDGKQILSSGMDGTGTVRLWDVGQAKEIRRWQHFSSWPSRFAPDGRHFWTFGESAVTFWDTAADQKSQSLPLGPDKLGAVGIAADGRRFLYALEGDTTVRLLELPSGKELASFEMSAPPFGYMSFSPDGHHAAAACPSGWVYLWRLPDTTGPANK